MRHIFDPSRNSVVNNNRINHGYVTRLKELPLACDKYEGLVVFCSEDKRFYECQHIETPSEDYYEWIAVTAGAQRLYFIPVEALTDTELPTDGTMTESIRTCCFDAIASAIDEIAIGLYKFGINVEPLCYKICYDTKFIDGRVYYVYNNSFDRAEFVPTTDTTPDPNKTYYIPDVNLKFISVFFNEGESFNNEVRYYESTRPRFVIDDKYVAGGSIDHRVFVSNGQDYQKLTKKELVAKLNVLVDIVNVTGCKVPKATDAGDLFQLCTILNQLIDELNPFAHPWNNLLNRVNELENQLKNAELGVAKAFDLPITVKKGGKTYSIDIVEGDGNRMLTAVEVTP